MLKSLIGLLSSLIVTATLWAAPKAGNGSPPVDDVWGLYLTGELTLPRRDDGNEIQPAFGWPRRIASEAPLWGRSPAVFDIDNNGDLEIAIVNGDGRLFVFQHDGALFPGFPTELHRGNRPNPWEDPTHRALAAICDIDRDAILDVVYSTDISYLHVVGSHQQEPNPFPIDLQRGVQASTIVTLDVNNDGSGEMIFTTHSIRPLNDEEAFLHVVEGSGVEFEGWPVRCGVGSGGSPAVGDIDGDGGVEIVVGSGRSEDTPGQIYAFELDGTRVNGFPYGGFESIGGSLIVADWDTVAGMDIFFAATPIDGNSCALYGINFHGDVLRGFPRAVGEGHPFGNPVIAGQTDDGRYSEIYFGGFSPNGNAHAFGFRYYQENDSLHGIFVFDAGVGVVGSIVTADIFGSSTPEIVYATAPHDDHAGRIIVASTARSEVIDLADYGGGAFASSPTLWDIDRDGRTEIIAVTTDGRVYVWNTEGLFTGEIWPTERGDFARSGRKMSFVELSINDDSETDYAPGRFILDTFPNPFNSRIIVSINTTVSGSSAVGLYNLQGRMVAETAIEHRSIGKTIVAFNTGNLNLSSGVYFVRWSMGGEIVTVKSVLYLP